VLPRDKRVEKIDLAYVSLCGDVIAVRDGIALLLCCAAQLVGVQGKGKEQLSEVQRACVGSLQLLSALKQYFGLFNCNPEDFFFFPSNHLLL